MDRGRLGAAQSALGADARCGLGPGRPDQTHPRRSRPGSAGAAGRVPAVPDGARAAQRAHGAISPAAGRKRLRRRGTVARPTTTIRSRRRRIATSGSPITRGRWRSSTRATRSSRGDARRWSKNSPTPVATAKARSERMRTGCDSRRGGHPAATILLRSGGQGGTPLALCGRFNNLPTGQLVVIPRFPVACP